MNAKNLANFAFYLVGGLFLSSCQTSPAKEFQDVKVGMEKNDVLEKMGSPAASIRFHGKDRWKYIYYDNQTRVEKEIQFQNGVAIYVGEPWQPPVEKSAKAMDEQFELANKHADEEALRVREENKKAVSQYEADSSGLSSSKSIRYVPEYVPVK